MSQFIIEMGSANEHHNDISYLRKMIDAVVSVDSGKHQVIFKHQLFKDAPPNLPLDWDVFGWAFGYAWKLGYQTTASVFDIESLHFLEQFHVPFVKIANRPKLYWLAGETTRPVYLSVSPDRYWHNITPAARLLVNVPKYPADKKNYLEIPMQRVPISDHTVGWDLYYEIDPTIIEKHFCLERDPDNPDSGPFAVTPKELAEVL